MGDTETVSAKITEKMVEKIEKQVEKTGNYNNKSDWVRCAIREKIEG